MTPAGRPPTLPTAVADRHGGRVWMVVRGGWRGSDFNVVARYFITKLILAICRRQFTNLPACSEVADFRCLMRTSAKQLVS